MKKWIMFLSYPGIGILLFITGIEIFRRKKPLDFWLRFWSVTVGLTFLLIFVPLGLVSVLLSTPFKNVIFRRNGMSFFAGQHTGVYSLNH